MTTYEFIADWVIRKLNGRPARVLDYGCGAGQIIDLLRSAGIDAVGCDVFYGGGDRSGHVPAELQPFIRRMTGDVIPYDDRDFDIVVSNQVLEHVADIEAVLREMARVLKPGGYALNVFPHRAVWREGHCYIPLLHRFPKGSTVRIYYAAALHALGFGYQRKAVGSMQWARRWCQYLDDWTHYRSLAEIHEHFGRVLGPTHHSEEEWLRARFGGRLGSMPVALQRLLVRKLGGVTLVSVRQ